MKKLLLFFALFACIHLGAQENIQYVAIKGGLNLRENPNPSARVLGKISYGAKLSLLQSAEESTPMVAEGFNGTWKKVVYNDLSGYIFDAYLLPFPPPTGTVKTLKDYIAELTTKHGELLVVKNDSTTETDEISVVTSKQLYKNGAEWHKFLGYEYSSSTYFIPGISLQQGFLVVRLIPEFADYVSEKDPFITAGKKLKKGGREYEYLVDKETNGGFEWIKKISIGFEEGAIYSFELYQIDNQVVIFHGSGV